MEQRAEKEIQPGIITAPFSKEQVEALNFYQQSGFLHPFTCGYPHHELKFSPDLVAETDGWHCTLSGCRYTQNWAHSLMADRKFIEESMKFLGEASANSKKLSQV